MNAYDSSALLTLARDTSSFYRSGFDPRIASRDPRPMITVIVCITCGQQAESIEGRRPGEHFADRVEEVLQTRSTSEAGAPAMQLQRTKCLMSCQRSCSAALHQEGKYSYVFGEFLPDRDSAEALLDFAAGYRVSDTGQVPFKQWPQGIKGHFVARVPPIEFATNCQRDVP